MVITMIDNNLLWTILATTFTWGLTALGAATVFFFKKVNHKVMSFMFGFGAGVMIAASFFSLLMPGIELSENLNQTTWLIIGLGFFAGSIFILIIDLTLPHMHIDKNTPEGLKSNFSRKLLLILAITLHNIPEGMAIGVAFGASSLNIEGATIYSAIILALGIGIQNFPEGMAVSLPLVSDGMKKSKAFFYGQASGIVEPLSAILGLILVTFVRKILPFVLASAAGAMIYVVVEELIPSGKNNTESKLGTIGAIIGFMIMMILDLSLS